MQLCCVTHPSTLEDHSALRIFKNCSLLETQRVSTYWTRVGLPGEVNKLIESSLFILFTLLEVAFALRSFVIANSIRPSHASMHVTFTTTFVHYTFICQTLESILFQFYLCLGKWGHKVTHSLINQSL